MAEIELLSEFKRKAATKGKVLILPESHDRRVLEAAEKISKEGIAHVITIGEEKEVLQRASSLGIDVKNVEIISALQSPERESYIEEYFELRKKKGMTMEKAGEIIRTDLFFSAMMMRHGLADCSVAGSTASTADVLKSALQCVGMKQGTSVVSSFFFLLFPDRYYAFSDCSVVPLPTEEQLADIAISTADSYKRLTGQEAVVAMLSFSTKGSARHQLIDKVVSATKIAQTKRPDLCLDGEIQFDAAIIPEIGQKKAPGSPVAGKANVLVFPDLQAGNIGYKIAQRLGGAEAVGPVVQGLNKPCFDLSRGCSVDDIVNTAAIAVLMS